MSSSVHFRFKSAREFETLSFEGDFLKVADLKVAIVERKKLNFGEGFDLEISDASTADVFNDESALVQKNTSVIVRRIPGLKQGGILSHQEMAAKNERYAEKQGTKPQQRTVPSSDHNSVVPKTIEGSDEAERIASLVMQSNVQYDQFPPPIRGRHPNRSNNRGRSSGFGAPRNAQGQPPFQGSGHATSAYPERAPKPSSNYVCHRCNRPGHWIDQCPTNGNPAYDRIKVRAPTGIPRSMLRQVDAPESGTGLQDSSGHFVTLQPNEEEFARQTVGLRLSQAAASTGDSKLDVKTNRNVEEAKPDLNDIAGATPEQGAHDNVEGEKDVQSRASQQQKRNKHAHNGGQLNDNGDGENPDQKTENETADSTSKSDSMKTHPSKRRVAESGTIPKETSSLKAHGKKPNSALRTGHTQPPSQPGIPHIMPVPPIPTGFPPLGMPPIPSGMPPIPPHVLMAMAMANQQNGQASQPPPGMPPNMPIPFTSSPPSISDVKRKDKGTPAHEVVSERQKMPQHGKKPREMDDKVSYESKLPRTEVEETRHTRGSNTATDRGDSSRAIRDKTYPLSETIGFAAQPKQESSSPRAKRLDKGRTRNHENSPSYAHETGIRGDRFSDSREITSASIPYNRREANRSRSPPIMALQSAPGKRSRSPVRRDRRSRADRDFTSLSPKRRPPAKGRDEYHLSYSRREPRHSTKSSYDHKGGTSRDDDGSGRDFSGRGRVQPPSPRSKHGVNGTMSPDIPGRRGRSPEGRMRFSPSRHMRGNSSRDWFGQGSPDRKIRRGSSSERRLRSVTPPRNGGNKGRSRENIHARPYRILDQAKRDWEFDAGRGADPDRVQLKLEDRPGRKTSKSGRNDLHLLEDTWHISRHAEERRKKPRHTASDRSSPESGDKSRAYHDTVADSRRKRELNGRPHSDYRDIKRQRRQQEWDRTHVQRDDMRDGRVSVHDRLGRPVSSRRRKDQRKSVHDRLG